MTEELKLRAEKMAYVMQALLPWRREMEAGGWSMACDMECPVCAGRLQMSIDTGGVMDGHCATPGCVSWKEKESEGGKR